MRNRVPKGYERAIRDDRLKRRTLLCGENRARRAHRYSPQDLRTSRCFFRNQFRGCADITAFENTDRGEATAALSVIPEIKQKNSVAALVRFSSPLEHFEPGAIQPVDKDDNWHRGITRIPPPFKGDAVGGSE